MADEQNANGQSANSGDKSDDSKIAALKAELESLRQDAAVGQKVLAKVRAAEYDDPDQYLEDLETYAGMGLTMAKEKKGEETPSEKTNTTVTEQPQFNEQMRQAQINTALASWWTDYKLDESDKSSDDRDKLSRGDLNKMIFDPKTGAEIQAVAKMKFDGNVYAAAAHIKRIESADERATKRAEAKAKAAETAGANGGSGVPVTGGGTTSRGDWEKKMADDIAPDSPGI
mgnify:CR=1 FL=1